MAENEGSRGENRAESYGENRGESRAENRGYTPAAGYYGDEVSLRELYLIFRGGLALIVILALVVGIVTYAVRSFGPDRFTATATVNVIPPLVGTDSLSGLELSVSAGMDPEGYEATAFSLDLLDTVAAGFDLGEGPLNGKDLLPYLDLVTRQAPSQARGHMVADHRVTLKGEAGAEQADALANAWADATVAAVAQALSSHLAGAVETVSEEISMRRAAFDAASDAWAEFLATDERVAISNELASLALDPASDPDETAALRARLAEQEATAARLERELSTTSLVYYRVAPTGPALELQRDLVAGSVFVAIEASTPVRPVTTSPLVIAVAAALVAALVVTLLVFLRAAVRER